jgi:DNA-binding response OmpR family regulator
MRPNCSSQLQRVLVVDDELTLLSVIAMVLKEAGFEVFTAANGKEASAVLSSHTIDLLITDLAMPDEDGIEIIRRIKKEHPRLKIIAMSGTFGAELLTITKHLGADATLPKPMTASNLLDCIRTLDVDRATLHPNEC